MTLRELYKYAEIKLNNLDYRTLKYELRLILEYYLNMKETEILLSRDVEIPDEKLQSILKAIEKRLKGYPLQYIRYLELYGYKFVCGRWCAYS